MGAEHAHKPIQGVPVHLKLSEYDRPSIDVLHKLSLVVKCFADLLDYKVD